MSDEHLSPQQPEAASAEVAAVPPARACVSCGNALAADQENERDDRWFARRYETAGSQ